jgi:MFS family permease
MANPLNPLQYSGANTSSCDFEEATYRKVARRLLPLLLLCFVAAYLDRVNIGFAKLQMSKDLNFSDTVYGLGAGIFFVGYFIFEIPSNIVLHRVGARVWIARIMVTWGLISMLTMFVTTPMMFYVMRFLLGVAEAGFAPGIILYLTYWFPEHRRGRMTAWLIVAVPLSCVIGGPVSGYILETFDGVNQWHGWQWLLLLESLPSVILGVIVLVALDDRIATAKWLTAEERQLLERNLATECVGKEDPPIRALVTKPRVWLISAIYFSFVMGLYGVSFWLPTIINATGITNAGTIGLLSAIPFAAAMVAMPLVARSSDRMGERHWHLVLTAVAGAIGLILSAFWIHDTALAIASLTLATMGILATLPLFWNLPTAFLTGAGAAVGIAMINSIGNLAGFLSPYAIGWLRQMSDNNGPAMYMLSGFMIAGVLLTVLSRFAYGR